MTRANSPAESHPGLPATEGVHPLGPTWANAQTLDALRAFAQADREAVAAVEAAHEDLARLVDRVSTDLAAGGRLIYVGAGTSGRLGALDAAECPPTFQSSPEQVRALLAGGPGAMTQAVEGAEDDLGAGHCALVDCEPQPGDVVLGISASGSAPFVHGALQAAKEAGAWSVLLACVPIDRQLYSYDDFVCLLTGPELLSGSTRLKAGTATKVALNALSTLVMARLGKVYEHRMVDVHTAGNRKLWQRGVRMVHELTALDLGAAEECLQAAEGSVKHAVLMQLAQLTLQQARTQLERHDQRLDLALAPCAPS